MVKYYFDFTIINFVSHRYQWFVYCLFEERPGLRGGRKLVYRYLCPIQLVTAPAATISRMRETVLVFWRTEYILYSSFVYLLVIIQKITIVYMMLVNNIIKTPAYETFPNDFILIIQEERCVNIFISNLLFDCK